MRGGSGVYDITGEARVSRLFGEGDGMHVREPRADILNYGGKRVGRIGLRAGHARKSELCAGWW